MASKRSEMHVTKVERERWEKAQEWEKRYWITTQEARAKHAKNLIWRILALSGLRPKYRGDDWNYWWKKHFDDYRFLPKVVNKAVELGCGPYTNFRLISEICVPKQLYLSDPLITTYIDFKLTFLSEMYRKGACIIDGHPIEECPFADDYFDLTVVINVLDHVQDAQACMEKAVNITKPEGILLLGQDLTNEVDALQPDVKEDVGHPVKIEHEWLDKFLVPNFQSIIHKLLPREAGRNPEAHYGTYLFAGRKLQKAESCPRS